MKNIKIILIVAAVWLCLTFLKDIVGPVGAACIVNIVAFSLIALFLFIAAIMANEQMAKLAHTLLGLLCAFVAVFFMVVIQGVY